MVMVPEAHDDAPADVPVAPAARNRGKGELEPVAISKSQLADIRGELALHETPHNPPPLSLSLPPTDL